MESDGDENNITAECVLKVHCFVGGVRSVQRIPLVTARRNLRHPEYKIEWTDMTVAQIKLLKWTPMEFVNWLCDCDIYLIIAHIHQGLLDTLQWNVVELKDCLEFLVYRNGFPKGKQLFCPVFLQDKYAYISAVPEICNPTLRVQFLDPDEDAVSTVDCGSRNDDLLSPVDRIAEILSFTHQHNEGEGWVVKAPYTTNCDFIRYCRTVPAVILAVATAQRRFEDLMPYVMIQPRMTNRREEKVVLVNGKPFYIADKAMNRGTGLLFASQDQLFEFAVDAVRLLKQRDPAFQSKGLVRVDIFCNAEGKLLVNEFESLEAVYYKKSSVLESRVTATLVLFWQNVLAKCILATTLERSISRS